MLGERENGSSTILITNDLMQQFGITQEQLHSDAMVNAPEIRPSEIHDMTEMMNEMFGSGMLPEVDPADEKLFVATVSSKVHGAGVITYPNFFENAAEKLGGDFYILPSSIHEVLLVRDNGEMSAEDLEAIVRSVNASEVQPEEQLTDMEEDREILEAFAACGGSLILGDSAHKRKREMSEDLLRGARFLVICGNKQNDQVSEAQSPHTQNQTQRGGTIVYSDLPWEAMLFIMVP